ncbi:MAG: DsbC family protein [Nitrospiraceae bacterium]|nr:DsbC family protein [Nitrospiraceae bacterium]
MKKLLVVLVGLLFASAPIVASAFPPPQNAKEDCLECHKLDKKDAEAILKKIAPEGTVVGIQAAPVKGLWQIEAEVGGKRGVFLLDFSKKYLVDRIVPVDSLGPKKTDFSKLPLKDAVILGAKGAKKKVAVFTDPDCPYCRKLHEELKQVIEKRKDIAFYLFLYPLPSHKDAYKKAQAILCEKSHKLLDDAFSGKEMPEPKCGNEQVEKNLALGKQIGINGTPAIIREDGLIQGGYLPADKLADWIDGK